MALKPMPLLITAPILIQFAHAIAQTYDAFVFPVIPAAFPLPHTLSKGSLLSN